jgi:nucleotidyltransferase/DNA polymerase involved in DNA repair
MKKTVRRDSTSLEDLPNVGKSVAADFRRLGVRTPRDLRGRDPYALYAALNRATGTRHDPCVLDTFIAAVRYVEGAPARPWWKYTQERKRTLAAQMLPQKESRERVPARKPPVKTRSTVPNSA